MVVEGGGSEPDQHLMYLHLNSFRLAIGKSYCQNNWKQECILTLSPETFPGEA